MDQPERTDASREGSAPPVRFGVLSTANIAVETVVPGMRRARGCEVLGIGSRDGERARRVASQLGIRTVNAVPATWRGRAVRDGKNFED